MKTHRVLVWCVAVALTVTTAVVAAVQVTADKENVVASRLEGKWVVGRELNLDLTGRPDAIGESVANRVEFTSDKSVAAAIPDKYDSFLGKKTIYLAGMMTLRGRRHPFVLVSHRGNPHVVYFRERDGHPMGDAESFNVMLAPADDRKNDLLFIGGDFNNQPFAAFERVERHAPREPQNALTPKSLELHPTFNNMTVTLRYGGDDDRDAKASLRYRKAGDGQWREAHPPVRIDAKMLGGRMWTGSLLFLDEGTRYDVKMTLTDPDGVVGKGEFTAAMATRKTPNTSTGETITVTPGMSIQTAFDRATPGTTVLVGKGTYWQMVEGTKHGTAEAPITIRGEKGARIFGSEADLAAGKGWKHEGGVLYSTRIKPVRRRVVAHEKSGRLYDYDDLSQLKAETFRSTKEPGKIYKIKGGWTQAGDTLYVILPDHGDPRTGGVHVSVRESCIRLTGSSHVTIEGFELAYAGESYGSCLSFDRCSNIWVHHNHIHHFRKRGVAFHEIEGGDSLVEYNTITDFPVGEWPWRAVKSHDAEDSAISFRTGRGCVARYNLVDNLFNGIDASSFFVSGNLIRNIGDDAVEIDGHAINHRIYHNVISNTNMAFSISPLRTGPIYVVRNTVRNYKRYVWKAQNGVVGHVFLYHNSIWADKDTIDPARLRVINTSRLANANITGRNNMFWAYNYMLRQQGWLIGPFTFDHNAYFNPLGKYTFQWGGVRARTLEDFQKTGQEKHGFVADPKYADARGGNLSLLPASPLRDRGVVIPGINDHTPDGKPDIGAYEHGQPRWDVHTGVPQELKHD